MLYAPVRFSLDFLRSTDLGVNRSDIRYLGLTPAQYLAMAMFVGGLSILLWMRSTTDPEESAPAETKG